MGLVILLFSFHGRIGRAAYWSGGLAVLMAFYLGYMASLAPLFSDDAGSRALAAIAGPLIGLSLFCGGALSVKRLHDRGRSGWLALLLMGPLSAVGSYVTGFGALDASLSGLSMAVYTINLVIAFYFVVELGILDGDPAPNQFDAGPGATKFTAFARAALTQASHALGKVKIAASGRLTTAHVPQAETFANAEAAIERAIAERGQSAEPAPAAAPSAHKSFGRRA